MVNATHFLDVRLAVDYGQVFSPENIKGIKFILGLNTDDEVMAHINNEIITSISDALIKKSAYVEVADALINAIPQAESKVVEESFSPYKESNDELEPEPETEPEPEPELELETDYEDSSLNTDDTFYLGVSDIEDEFVTVEPEDEAWKEVQVEEELISLSNALNNDIFTNTAFSATNLEVYLYKYEEYGARLRDVVESSIPIRDLSNLIGEVEDFGEVDYVIKYTDVSGEVKYGKRKLNNENTKKENV